jgi:tetratricopeptide (TPR) repeat protein
LALDAGKVAREAQEDVTEAFQWAEAGRMEDALRRIEVLGEKKYFLAALRLLWIEADRQAKRPETERTAEVAQDILSAVEKHIAPGTRAIDWSEFAGTDFMAWWTAHVSAAMPSLDVSSMLTRTSELREIVEALAEHIVEDEGVATIGSLGRVSLGVARKIVQDDQRTQAMSRVARALTEMETTDRALPALEEARAAAREIGDDHWRAKAMTEVVGALAETEATEEARFVFEETLAAAREIDFDQARAEALSGVARALTEMEATDRAIPAFEGVLAAAQEIGDDRSRAKALSEVARALAETEATDRARSIFEEARAAAREIDDNRSRAATFSRVTMRHVKAGLAHAVADYLPSIELAREGWILILSSWRETLVGHKETPSSLLRQSLMLYPFDVETATKGVYALVQAHAQAGTIKYVEAIARECPELGLDVVVK